MKQIHKIFLSVLALVTPMATHAQSLQFDTDDSKADYILTAKDTVTIGYENDMTTVAVMSNCSYTVTANDSWLTCVTEADGNLTLFSDYYYETSSRTGSITLTSADGNVTRTVVVVQSANTSASEIEGDTKLTVSTATASSSQSGEGISLSYDGDVSTYYHSNWSTGTTMPVTLTYTLADFPHVDYLIYTPRQDGNSNGNFENITVEYCVSSSTSTWVTVGNYDLGGSSSSTMIEFGEDGADNVYRVRITVNSGTNNYASCAEMEFYQTNSELSTEMAKYFEDDLCTTLKSGVTEADLAHISNAYVRQLVYQMLKGGYSTTYRVGEFEPYRTLSSLKSELKTSNNYNSYENPTGIYFTSGETLALFVEGIPTGLSASLIIKSFGEDQDGDDGHPQSTYALKNGVNVITTQNRGNGYISYYTDQYETASNIKIHFALATENGYFDLERGDDNTYWAELLENAVSDILDVRSKRLQVACPVDILKSYCPTDGVALATIYDSVVYREREIMGLELYGREPKNRQFARPVDSGMYADGIGAAASFGSFYQWINTKDFGYWALGHELGHINQVTPGFKWVGCGETTNNVYSAWVEHKLGSGYHRLEDEVTGIDDYSSLRGGRFETYLEEGVRKGVSWQLQDGPDYNGNSSTSITVTGEDYEGNSTGSVTTTYRNYDHFVKVVPFWQLELYCMEAGKSPNAFAKFLEGVRTNTDDDDLSNGQLQIKFMRSFCDSTQTNFLDFFEKAGMLLPIDAYIEDYTRGWLKINQTMIDELKEYIEAKNYPEPAAAINYINAYNWETFRDEAPLTEATLNSGCTRLSSGRIQVDGNVWQNAVGFETYDADGNLLHISMYGLGAAQQSSRYTQVLWNSSAAYIMAVGYDGTRVKCYEP